MKKLFLILAAIVLVAIEGKTQSVFPLDTVILTPAFFEKTEELIKLNVFDTLTVIQSTSKRSSKTFVNEVVIDSCLNNNNRWGTVLGDVVLYTNNMIYFDLIRGIVAYDPKLISCKDILTKDASRREKEVLLDISRTQLYSRYNMSQSVLYLIDKDTGKETMIADFRPYIDREDYPFKPVADKSIGSIEQVCAIGKSSYIVKAGVWDMYSGDSYVELKYYKVINNKIIDLTTTVKQWVKEQKIKRNVTDRNPIKPLDEMSLCLLSNDASSLRGIVVYWESGYADNKVRISMIVNTDLQFVSPVLALKGSDERGGKNYNEVGINKQQGKIVNYFMWSNLNDEAQTKVIVPYVFSPHLDILMYQTYSGDMLKKEDLKGFSKYELGILRNLIFAKYNYAFSSEFYQAYFNLYEFYGNKDAQKSREKDINNKLTETDKANIKLIKERENLK